MNLLQITKKFPFPLKDGESIAVNNLARGLKHQNWSLDLLTMNTSKHPVSPEGIEGELDHYERIYHQKVDNKVTWMGALSHLLRGKSYQADRFVDPDFHNLLIKVLKENKYDVVQLESPYLAPYISTIRKYSDAHLSMRAHNVEHVIWERLAEHTSWGLKKWYFQKVARELKTLELNYLNEYDSLIAISEHDERSLRKMGFAGDSISIPIGLDVRKYKSNLSDKKDISFAFIGTLDWLPNQQGLEWFLKEVWPSVIKVNDRCKFYIAGRGAGHGLVKLLKQTDNCIYIGEVEHANAFLDEHPIMIVPLLSGSGIRVKIIEGMAKGMLVITTPCGKEGIPSQHMENMLIAEKEDKFATMILYAMEHPQDVNIMREKAMEFAQKEYDLYSKGAELDQFYRQKLGYRDRKPESIVTFEP